jgi:predicted small lipoprotein YifL
MRALALPVLLALAACGQKGNLYLPDEAEAVPGTPAETAPAAEPATAADDTDDDSDDAPRN